MSDINLDFTVSNNSIDFTVQPNDITITPTDVQLTLNANFQPLAGGSPFQLQFNNAGILGGVANSSYTSGNLTLGDVANIKITGGTNGYVLQTDGAGNLDWTAMSGGGGNGTPGGSNTQIQYNDAGAFGGNAGFTFNETTGNVAIPGSLTVVGNITGNVQNAYLANYATVANSVAGANVSGQVNFAATANSVAGSNVSGQVGNALIAGTVYTNAQPNITSVGTLGNLTVTGNIVGGNISGNFNVSQIANGTSNINIPATGGNINASVGGNANILIITSTGVNVSGRLTSTATIAAPTGSFTSVAGQITTASQPSITSLGNLTDLRITNSRIHLGTRAGETTQGNTSVALGFEAARTNQGSDSIAIGDNAGYYNQGNFAIAVGYQAAGNQTASQSSNAIAIGSLAGYTTQGTDAVAIGNSAGYTGQNNNTIAIGSFAGRTNQHVNSIILNSSGANLNSTQANSLFIKPIRDVTGNVDFTVTLKYNPTTGEIGYV